jgi:hypothetical protein
MSPRPVDGFSPAPEDWRTPTNSERPSSVSGPFPPRRQTIAEGEVQSYVSEQSDWLPPRAAEPRHRRREDKAVDIFPLAESPNSIHDDELSAADRARAEARNAPKPSSGAPPWPALDPDRLSSIGVPTACSSASSGHNKRTPSLKLCIPDGRTTLSTPRPCGCSSSRGRSSSQRRRRPSNRRPSGAASRRRTRTSRMSSRLRSCALKPAAEAGAAAIPPRVGRRSVRRRERRVSTVIQPAPPAPTMAHTASHPATAPIRTTTIKAQPAKIAPAPRDVRNATRPRPSPSPSRAPPGKQAREFELRRRTPSPPLRVPSLAARPGGTGACVPAGG